MWLSRAVWASQARVEKLVPQTCSVSSQTYECLYWADFGEHASILLAKDLPTTLPSEKTPTSPARILLSTVTALTRRDFSHLMKCWFQSLQEKLQLPNFLVNFQVPWWFGSRVYFRVNNVYKMWFGCLVFGARAWSDWPLWDRNRRQSEGRGLL